MQRPVMHPVFRAEDVVAVKKKTPKWKLFLKNTVGKYSAAGLKYLLSSPVRFGSRYWKRDAAHPVQRALPNARACLVHGRAAAPAQDHAEPHGFWGALGCACWAF